MSPRTMPVTEEIMFRLWLSPHSSQFFRTRINRWPLQLPPLKKFFFLLWDMAWGPLHREFSRLVGG